MPRVAAVLLLPALVLALSACVDAGTAPTLPTETATSAPVPTGTPTTTPTATPAPGAAPIDITCADLVDPDAVYAFDPNYGLLGSWNPPAGSAAAEAVAAGGVACRWVRETGQGTIDLSVARLDDADLTAKKNAAYAESQMVPTYGVEGYFEVAGGVGTAIVFPGNDWIVISAEAFAEPGEPTDIILSAIDALSAR